MLKHETIIISLLSKNAMVSLFLRTMKKVLLLLFVLFGFACHAGVQGVDNIPYTSIRSELSDVTKKDQDDAVRNRTHSITRIAGNFRRVITNIPFYISEGNFVALPFPQHFFTGLYFFRDLYHSPDGLFLLFRSILI